MYSDRNPSDRIINAFCICKMLMFILDSDISSLFSTQLPIPRYRMYVASTVASSGVSRSCAKFETFPFCLESAALRNWLTHAFTSVTSGQGSRVAFLMVVSCVKPTPKLMSSGSCSAMTSSVAARIGGLSRSLSKASQVNPQPFLYFSANAVESVKVFVREMTAILRSNGRRSFCVSGNMMLR